MALQKNGCGSMYTAAAFALQTDPQSPTHFLPPSAEGAEQADGGREGKTQRLIL